MATARTGQPVYLKDIWPTLKEIRDQMQAALKPEVFQKLYRDFAGQNPKWNEIPSSTGNVYEWDEKSTYIQEPAVFSRASACSRAEIREIKGARALGIFGDSVTTDHISPAGSIKKTSPAGKYLQEERAWITRTFNSYGSRRGNDRVMTRGTFAKCAHQKFDGAGRGRRRGRRRRGRARSRVFFDAAAMLCDEAGGR